MSVCARAAASALLITAAQLPGGTARAAVGGRLSITSNDIFRGRSISEGRPALALDLSLDRPSGIYAGIQAKGFLSRHDGAQWLSAEQYVGQAWRLNRQLTLDLGLTNTNYSRYSALRRGTNYSELTIGLIGRRLSARVSLSPNWFGWGNVTAYGETGLQLGRADGWQVNLHGGALVWLANRQPGPLPRTHYDARISLGRDVGRFHVDLAETFGGPGTDIYDGKDHGHTAVVVSVALRL